MKTVIEMAQEAGFTEGEIAFTQDNFLFFAELVRADEREACAKVIDSHGPFLANGAMLADAIRARSNT